MLSQINWDAVGFFWGVVVTLLQVGTAVLVLMFKRQAQSFQSQAATSDAIQAVSTKLMNAIATSVGDLRKEVMAEIQKLEHGDRSIDRRVVVLEQAIAHAPKARDLSELRLEIGNLRTQVARSEGAQMEQNSVLRLIHEFLMEKGR